MADSNDRAAENAAGPFYVDSQCIACGVCTETAPENFAMNEEEGYAYVTKQPETAEEKDACRESIEECPVEAIGDDG